MSWLITFGIFIVMCIFACLGVAFIEGMFDLGGGLGTWKAYFTLITTIIGLLVVIYLVHNTIVTRHLFGC